MASGDGGDYGSCEYGEPVAPAINLDAGADMCQALMDRYGRSSTPHHRHLIATAAAMRSVLVEEGLPCTPPAYLASAITSLRRCSGDPAAASALAAFLVILIPAVRRDEFAPHKASDAAAAVAVLAKEMAGGAATGTVRSVVKSLGLLILLGDLDDWSCVRVPMETLLLFTVDKRPKVRRCAQLCVMEVFKSLQNSHVIKKTFKLVLASYMNHFPLAKNLKPPKRSVESVDGTLLKPENVEILHMLNLLKLLVPNLSDKLNLKIFACSYKLFTCSFSIFTRQMIALLEVLICRIDGPNLVSIADIIMQSLLSYASCDEKNPTDTVISALTLLKEFLNKLHAIHHALWTEYFPLIFRSIAGYLCSDASIAKQVADILKDLLHQHIDQYVLSPNTSQSNRYIENSSSEARAFVSICTVFDKMISASIPTQHMLSVVSVLILKLGDASFDFAKEIILKLLRIASQVTNDVSPIDNIEECIGAATIAMGPEKLLLLVPVSFSMEDLTVSNTWVIPILKKYVVGASLKYFMDHILPLIRSIQNSHTTVKEARKRKDLQCLVHDLWDLLPSFCRFPIDTQNFQSLSELLIVTLKENSSLYEIIARALKELVDQNRTVLSSEQDKQQFKDSPKKGFFALSSPVSPHYSKKTSSRNLKLLASSSMDLLLVLSDIFFDSPSKERIILKETIESLASIIGTRALKKFYLSLLDRIEVPDSLKEVRKLDIQTLKFSEQKDLVKEKVKDKRCLVLELAFSLIEAADEDLVNIIFGFIKSCLMDNDGSCQCEAYYVLSRILKEHGLFCSTHFDEIMDLLMNLTTISDSSILKSRLECFHFILIHLLKINENMNTKAFFLLNEILLILKSKKESRKLAYDLLLSVSNDLRGSISGKDDTCLRQLFSMVMGYLSGPSPHIVSGAISALSLLIHNDASFSLTVPNLIPSIILLLQNKAFEVIKAALGFIKVLVSSLNTDNLLILLPDLITGILPWSSVSKHHFKFKVGIILEILIRKCGADAVNIAVPGKYKGYVKSFEVRRGKKNLQAAVNSLTPMESSIPVNEGGHKSLPEATYSPPESSKFNASFHRGKKRKGRRSSDTNDSNQIEGKGYRKKTRFQAGAASNINPQLLAKSREHVKRNKTKNFDHKRNIKVRKKAQVAS